MLLRSVFQFFSSAAKKMVKDKERGKFIPKLPNYPITKFLFPSGVGQFDIFPL